METAGWPVDVPRARVDLVVGRRRHRWLTMPSGILLFLCMFLPAVHSCGSDVYPVEMPYFWHPYVYGLGLALASLALTARSVRHASRLMRTLAWGSLAAGIVVTLQSAVFGLVEIVIGVILVVTIDIRGHSERRVALSGIVVSVLCLLWFGLWSGSADALIGIYISLGASIFLLAGSLLWLSEI